MQCSRVYWETTVTRLSSAGSFLSFGIASYLSRSQHLTDYITLSIFCQYPLFFRFEVFWTGGEEKAFSSKKTFLPSCIYFLLRQSKRMNAATAPARRKCLAFSCKNTFSHIYINLLSQESGRAVPCFQQDIRTRYKYSSKVTEFCVFS